MRELEKIDKVFAEFPKGTALYNDGCGWFISVPDPDGGIAYTNLFAADSLVELAQAAKKSISGKD